MALDSQSGGNPTQGDQISPPPPATTTITGAATETTLAALSGKFSSLGQKTMALSAPVVIASDQTAIPVSGTIAVTGTLTDTQLRASPVPISGTVTANVSGTVPVSGAFYQATQPVSIASMPSTPVTGTFWQATQPVSGTITANAGSGTFAISAASLPLPTGAAADATLTGGTQQSKITDGSNVVGVAASTSAASETAVDRLKVNAALRLLDTSQSAGSQLVAAKGDQIFGMWVNVKAAALPTGAATEAKQPALGTAGLPSNDVLTIQGAPLGYGLRVCLPNSSKADMAMAEQLDQLFAASCAQVHLLTELVALMRGRPDPLPGEEGDTLIGEYLDSRNRFTSIIN